MSTPHFLDFLEPDRWYSVGSWTESGDSGPDRVDDLGYFAGHAEGPTRPSGGRPESSLPHRHTHDPPRGTPRRRESPAALPTSTRPRHPPAPAGALCGSERRAVSCHRARSGSGGRRHRCSSHDDRINRREELLESVFDASVSPTDRNSNAPSGRARNPSRLVPTKTDALMKSPPHCRRSRSTAKRSRSDHRHAVAIASTCSRTSRRASVRSHPLIRSSS